MKASLSLWLDRRFDYRVKAVDLGGERVPGPAAVVGLQKFYMPTSYRGRTSKDAWRLRAFFFDATRISHPYLQLAPIPVVGVLAVIPSPAEGSIKTSRAADSNKNVSRASRPSLLTRPAKRTQTFDTCALGIRCSILVPWVFDIHYSMLFPTSKILLSQF